MYEEESLQEDVSSELIDEDGKDEEVEDVS